MTYPDVIEEACSNARQLNQLCELLGLGQAHNGELPALLEHVITTHPHHQLRHTGGVYFWEHGYEEDNEP